jgi:hypothetical protein
VLLKNLFWTIFGLRPFLGRVPAKIKNKCNEFFICFFYFRKNKNIFRKLKYVIPRQIFWRIRICFQNLKTFTKSGVISFLRLRAKIGTLESYKPIFLLEDEVKIFSKISV